MEALDFIADTMHIAEARVYGVATFYSQFRLKPQGEHVIQVCNGTACNVKGSEDLLGELVAVLGIHAGDTTPDGKVTLEKVNCVGACGVAPAIVVDGEVHGRVTPKMVGKLARKLLTAPKPRRSCANRLFRRNRADAPFLSAAATSARPARARHARIFFCAAWKGFRATTTNSVGSSARNCASWPSTMRPSSWPRPFCARA
jgi:NADH-quinone oxidoreductase subunit E